MDPAVAVVVASLSLIASVIAAILAFRGKKGETKVSDDANLRDDQREFIAQLRDENSKGRDENVRERDARGKLELEIERLRLEIDRLRLELQQTRLELEAERRARIAGEARQAAQSENAGPAS